jgi:hypothetical protein
MQGRRLWGGRKLSLWFLFVLWLLLSLRRCCASLATSPPRRHAPATTMQTTRPRPSQPSSPLKQRQTPLRLSRGPLYFYTPLPLSLYLYTPLPPLSRLAALFIRQKGYLLEVAVAPKGYLSFIHTPKGLPLRFIPLSLSKGRAARGGTCLHKRAHHCTSIMLPPPRAV